jgi:ferrous iron transport protein B
MKTAGDYERHPALAEILEEAERLNPGGVLAIPDAFARAVSGRAEKIAAAAVTRGNDPKGGWEKRLDDLLTSRALGFPAMFLLLAAVFWITLAGANYPSELLAGAFSRGKEFLAGLLGYLHAPARLSSFFVDGVYLCTAWVVAVMLPPMAIFFPCFTLLEDLGYLPRAAFNLDPLFKKAGAHGKQSLTMSMGFGCNAAGVISCRIIESPRERLIAMLTNTFVPCNGRFPALAALAGLLAAGPGASFSAALAVAGTVVFGAAATLAVSFLLAKTLLKGLPSFFTLELPPYRKPRVGRIVVRSICDRTLFVLRRAVCVAAPAGAVIWLLANVHRDGQSLLAHGAALLDPFARLLGLDGHILLAFFLGLPANEIVLPILVMSYQAAGSLADPGGAEALSRLLLGEHGWTRLTVVCTMLFYLLHNPCATTLLTIRKEAGGLRWAVLGALLPLALACAVCFAVARAARLLGWA